MRVSAMTLVWCRLSWFLVCDFLGVRTGFLIFAIALLVNGTRDRFSFHESDWISPSSFASKSPFVMMVIFFQRCDSLIFSFGRREGVRLAESCLSCQRRQIPHTRSRPLVGTSNSKNLPKAMWQSLRFSFKPMCIRRRKSLLSRKQFPGTCQVNNRRV